MLTLLRREEKPPGLTRWLTSANPVERQYAAESLAEMGDTHGTDCLILLASLEDRKRRRVFVLQSVALWIIWLALLVLAANSGPAGILYGFGPLIYMAYWLGTRGAKVSRLQKEAVQKLTSARHSAAIPALTEALWRSEPVLQTAVLQGLSRLLPRSGKETRLSKRQWNLLLTEINPNKLSRQKSAVNTKIVIAILKAAVAADYFPAAPRIKKLAKTRKTMWAEDAIRPLAIHCYSVLEQVRLTELFLQCARKRG